MKNNKTLIFEGAEWADADTSKATDVGNCRIRTRIRNNKGRVIYLEMLCCNYNNSKTKPTWAKNLDYVTHIDFCFYEDAKWDKNMNFSKELAPLTKMHFEYNKDNILKFVNNYLDCSFDNMEVINEGLYVFRNDNPLCDCSNGNYIPFEDIEININELDGIKPLERKGRWAVYKISLDSLMQIPYIKKHIEKNISERGDGWLSKENLNVVFRWDKDGIITSLDLHVAGCIRASAEDVEKVINLIKYDHLNKGVILQPSYAQNRG